MCSPLLAAAAYSNQTATYPGLASSTRALSRVGKYAVPCLQQANRCTGLMITPLVRAGRCGVPACGWA